MVERSPHVVASTNAHGLVVLSRVRPSVRVETTLGSQKKMWNLETQSKTRAANNGGDHFSSVAAVSACSGDGRGCDNRAADVWSRLFRAHLLYRPNGSGLDVSFRGGAAPHRTNGWCA